MNVPDKWAAIVWMCRNQLGRRNITDEQKTALIGEAYKAQKLTQGNHAERGPDGKYLSAHNEHLGNQYTGGLQNGAEQKNGKTEKIIAEK